MSQISRRLLIAASGFSFIGVAPSAAHAQGFLLDLYAGVALPTGRLNDLTNAGFFARWAFAPTSRASG
jgi:hypothetical protein